MIRRGRDVLSLLSSGGLLLFLAGLVTYFGFKTNDFFSFDNALIILGDISVIGIVAIGQTTAIVSGGFDLSTSGMMPLGAVVFAKFLNSGQSFGLALILTVAVGMAVGAFNGFLIARVGINALIVTLGTLSVTAGIAASLANGLAIPFADTQLNVLAQSSVGNVQNSVWIFVGMAIVATLVLKYTTFGRSLYAIGGNAEASRLAGMNVTRVVWTVYVTTGCLSAFAGAILASQVLTGSTTIGTDSALTSIAAVILGGGSLAGGVGSIAGTVVGVLVLGVLRNGLSLMHVATSYQQIATGAMLIVAVALGRVRYGRLSPKFTAGRRRAIPPVVAAGAAAGPSHEGGER